MTEKTTAMNENDRLAGVARSAYAAVMAAGHAGLAGPALRTACPGLVGDPVEFVKKHAGLTLRKEGAAGADERYFVPATAAASD